MSMSATCKWFFCNWDGNMKTDNSMKSDGFSVPILCSCTDSGVVTGCNKNLWSLNSCPVSNPLFVQ
jgi:hypothetical protein